MRRSALLLLLAVTAAPAVAGQTRVERRLAVNADASIRIVNLTGSTRVTGWDRDSIAVSGTLPRGAQFFLGGSGAGAKLGVLSDSLNAPGADLDIRVPHGAVVWIKSAGAVVTVSAIDGDLDISSVGGDVRIDGTARRLTVESMDGDVTLATRAASTRVKTAGGAITLRGGGGDVVATSVTGAIRYLGAHRVLTGRLESVTGSVTFAGTVMRGGSLTVETHDGSVDLAVPPTQLADFDLTTFGGTITDELQGRAPLTPRGKPVRFTTGSGGAQIGVRTLKGNVRVASTEGTNASGSGGI